MSIDVTEIIPGLWMGGECLVPIPPSNFDVIISCREIPDIEIPCLQEIITQGGPVFHSVRMIDGPVEVPLWRLRLAALAIHGAAAEGKTAFCHCKMGRNRSGLVVAAYLIWHKAMSADDAIAIVRKKRPGALSNITFVKQLQSL